MLHILVQLISIANFGYAIYWDLFILDVPETFAGKWKYLTFWNLWIQLIYFSISLLNNIFGSHSVTKESTSSLQSIRDFMFATVAFPIGQFVGIIFWTLFNIDRELVFPKALDAFFPNYINHMMHTTVIPVQLLELILLYHMYPTKKSGMATTFAFCLIYLTWTMIIAHFGGIWVYPIFEVLEPVPRVGFMLVCSMFGGLLYFIGEFLNGIVWSKHNKIGKEELETQSTRVKGKKPKKAE